MNLIRRITASIMARSPKHSFGTASSCASSRRIPAEWLRRLLEDCAEPPPRLYAWTLANLPRGPSCCTINQSLKTSEPSLGLGDDRRRIYVLGVGNIGRLYASFLAKNTNRPPITLVVHRKELLEHWLSQPGIELVRDGKPERNAEFDIEWWTDTEPPQGPIKEPSAGAGIRNLIVATKAADALPQVDRLRRYLNGDSTVAFTQNGMCKLWPPLGDAYVAARFPGPTAAGPSWLACVTTHGVTSLGPFKSVHASPANVLVGAVTPVSGGDGRSRYLIEQIANAPGLAGREVPTRELWVSQLEKLVVNSIINPLTAVLHCKNGEIFVERGDGLTAVIDMLLEEASRTLRALVSHQSSDDILSARNEDAGGNLGGVREKLLERFSFERLRAMLYDVGARVAENTSSMLQDVRAGKKTEVEDFNGWLVETAKYIAGDEHGLPTHEKLIALVVDGTKMTRGEMSEYFLRG
ncbi:2-dehydropantoate 2-reductase (Ketopantoate reductase) (KPA reductase) (KPR) [Parahypoxylon ruwenzoriense]